MLDESAFEICFSMKVIHELIEHFKNRGVLTETQLTYLYMQGFYDIDPSTEQKYEEESVLSVEDKETNISKNLELLEDYYSDREKHCSAKKNKGNSIDKQNKLLKDINKKLADIIDNNRDRLDIVTNFARTISPEIAFIDAPIFLVELEEEQLQSALYNYIEKEPSNLDYLFQILYFIDILFENINFNNYGSLF